VQQLYNTVDLIFAGNLIDANASAAIGMSGMLITCLVGFFGGLAVGAGALAARAWGGHDFMRLDATVHSTVALCVAGSVVLLALGELITPAYLRLVRTPEAIMGMASVYLRIYFIFRLLCVSYNGFYVLYKFQVFYDRTERVAPRTYGVFGFVLHYKHAYIAVFAKLLYIVYNAEKGAARL
jgi:Na+-driven multidrug efflux pump